MVSLTNVVGGREKEFNEWYERIHLGDLLALDGMMSGQRYRLIDDPNWAYLADYEVETDDIHGLLELMNRRARSGEISFSPAFDTNYKLFTAEEIGPRHFSKQSG
ncbi:MAG: hypothetical protein ABIP41_06550 [Croceibacterium sp.]